jgi:hypothetical protein
MDRTVTFKQEEIYMGLNTKTDCQLHCDWLKDLSQVSRHPLLRKEDRLKVFKNKVSRRISWLEEAVWEKCITRKDLNNSCSSLNVTSVMNESRRMRRAGHATQGKGMECVTFQAIMLPKWGMVTHFSCLQAHSAFHSNTRAPVKWSFSALKRKSTLTLHALTTD